MLKQFLLVSSMTALLLGGFAHGQQSPLAIKRTPLGKVDVPGSNYEVIFGIAELSPGPKTGRHSHPGPVLAYVAEGEFWYLIDGQPEKIYKAGESFQVSNGAIHNEGASGDKPVKVMAVYVVEKGKPLVQPAQ
jgi:quercetin dioxygenase-like cupin family protein